MSTLSYKFSLSDVDENCIALILCRATNAYGRSEKYYDVYLTNSDGGKCFSTPSNKTITVLAESMTLQNDPSRLDQQTLIGIIAALVFLVIVALVLVLVVILLYLKSGRRRLIILFHSSWQ